MPQTQSYNALYVKQLQLKVADLEEELNRARQENTQTGMNEGLQARIDKLVMQYKQKIQDVEDEKIRVAIASLAASLAIVASLIASHIFKPIQHPKLYLWLIY